MVYFTADCHFGDKKVISHCRRPFSSLEKMHEVIVYNWNQRVRNEDVVYIVGDLFSRCKNPYPLLKELRGEKILITGNHDSSWLINADPDAFSFIGPMLEVEEDFGAFTICHYPMPIYAHSNRNYMIHGHIHNETHSDIWPYLAKSERILNAGVDINHFRPVTFDELLENNEHF